jgi:hypothetical protein
MADDITGACLSDQETPLHTVFFKNIGTGWCFAVANSLRRLFESANKGLFSWGPERDRIALDVRKSRPKMDTVKSGQLISSHRDFPE